MIDLNFDFSFFNWDFISNYLLKGLYFSIMVTIAATLAGFLFGTVLAMARMSQNRIISLAATLYIVMMRSVPLVLVIMWFFLVIPAFIGRPIEQTPAALITFIAFEAAYFAEIMRAGIQSIAPGQAQAGAALGMSYMQKMAIVILPQAFRNMLPVLLTQVIILFQDTSLVYVIGGYDLLKGFDIGGSIWQHKPEAYILAAVTYFVICFILSQIVGGLQKKIAIIR